MVTLAIDGKPLNDPANIYVIAEISGNHNQDYPRAERLIAAAAEAGASACKFQTFTREEICADVPILFGHDAAHDAWCQRLGVTRLRQLMSKGGLPREWHAPLKAFAEACGITFFSTPFSVDAARFLVEEIGVPALKIASGDLTFVPLLEYAASTQLPVIVSTGCATIDEVEDVGMLFHEAGAHERLAVLHCLTVYPCPEAIVNLRAIRRMQEMMQWACCEAAAYGFSDHTLSVDVVPALAVACGATLIEKHLTFDRDDGCVDSLHSLDPQEFKRMVDVLRQVPVMLGTGIKEPHPRERHDRVWARRSPEDWKRPTQAAREGAWE